MFVIVHIHVVYFITRERFIWWFTSVIYMYTLDRIEKGIPLKFQYDCNSANTNGVTYCIHSVIYNMYLFCY